MNIVTQEVLDTLRFETKDLLDILDKKGLTISAKLTSELISGLLENAIKEHIDGAVAPKKDSEPDILINGEPVEIKTSTGTTWRGGTYSKRPGYYILVNYKLEEDNTPSFYIAGIQLEEEDWKVSKSNDYYATSYNKKSLYHNRDRVTTYCGSLVGKQGKKRLTIKVSCE